MRRQHGWSPVSSGRGACVVQVRQERPQRGNVGALLATARLQAQLARAASARYVLQRSCFGDAALCHVRYGKPPTSGHVRAVAFQCGPTVIPAYAEVSSLRSPRPMDLRSTLKDLAARDLLILSHDDAPPMSSGREQSRTASTPPLTPHDAVGKPIAGGPRQTPDGSDAHALRRCVLPSTALQHGPDAAGEAFGGTSADEARPALWNLLPDCDVDASQHAQASHRPGCLPAALLVACPTVAEVYLQQAVARAPQPASPRGLVARTTEALEFPSPVPGLSAVEAALLAEAAASPLWSMGPTDNALAFRRCAPLRGGLAGAAQMQLKVRLLSNYS